MIGTTKNARIIQKKTQRIGDHLMILATMSRTFCIRRTVPMVPMRGSSVMETCILDGSMMSIPSCINNLDLREDTVFPDARQMSASVSHTESSTSIPLSENHERTRSALSLSREDKATGISPR